MDKNDGIVAVDATRAHRRTEATLTVGAMLNQGSTDESWGIDNLMVFVR